MGDVPEDGHPADRGRGRGRKALAVLKECGVRIVQGFLFSRPIPVEEYEKKYAVARPVPEGLPPSGRCA